MKFCGTLNKCLFFVFHVFNYFRFIGFKCYYSYDMHNCVLHSYKHVEYLAYFTKFKINLSERGLDCMLKRINIKI